MLMDEVAENLNSLTCRVLLSSQYSTVDLAF